MVDDIVQRACKVHDETGYIRLLVNEVERLRSIVVDMQQSQTYRYIGKNGQDCGTNQLPFFKRCL